MQPQQLVPSITINKTLKGLFSSLNKHVPTEGGSQKEKGCPVKEDREREKDKK
jgi:hypothetical protein